MKKTEVDLFFFVLFFLVIVCLIPSIFIVYHLDKVTNHNEELTKELLQVKEDIKKLRNRD